MSSVVVDAESVAKLTAMGYPKDQAEIALTRSGNDLNLAVQLLASGRITEEDDAEFDLIAAAPTEPAVRPTTVFQPRMGGHEGHDHFADVTQGSVSEMVDSRIAQFTEMGFSHEQAERALIAADNDVNAALTILFSGRAEDDGEFDLIAAAPTEPVVRPTTVFQPRMGGHEGHDHFADVTQGSVSEMVDSRIAQFTEMGFSHEQAEQALREADNDVNEALSILLRS